MGGGFKFCVYQKGKRLKTVKVTKNDKVKTVKLPKKKGAYYVKVTKLTSKTTGHIIWERIHIKNHKEGNWMKK